MASGKWFAKVWGVIGALGVLIALFVSIAELMDMRNEAAELRLKLESVKADHEEVKSKNQRLFSLVVKLIKDGSVSLGELVPFVTSAQASELSEEVSKSQKEQFPFYLGSQFFPSGWMGDGEAGTKYLGFRTRVAAVDGKEAPVIEIIYQKGPKGWAGLYWQYPDSNWGDEPGRNLLGAKKITFWAKGANGGEIVEFKSGGISSGPNKDSYQTSTGKVILEKNWKRYIIDLSKYDLSSVIGAFAWTVAASDNNDTEKVITYLASIRIE